MPEAGANNSWGSLTPRRRCKPTETSGLHVQLDAKLAEVRICLSSVRQSPSIRAASLISIMVRDSRSRMGIGKVLVRAYKSRRESAGWYRRGILLTCTMDFERFPDRREAPVLVTGASGFIGRHVGQLWLSG